MAFDGGLAVALQPVGSRAAEGSEAAASGVLSPAEQERARAMAPQARVAFVSRRLAQRTFAAALLDVPPSALQACYSCPNCGAGVEVAHGRPGYLLDGVPAPLLLSVSQAGGWFLLAALLDAPVGMALGADLEHVDGTLFPGFDGVALTEAERRRVQGLPLEVRDLERTRLWARKEAWLKMTGSGLRSRPEDLDVLERPGLADLDLGQWRSVGLPTGFAAAIAVTGP
ncbi:4'-phosphopantetheinyl transferase superfamily protein [Arthrobacter sp. M4]|nr:4'-phosphopantetheinyl transferase superfamily protein [Arthrobacter sp. M4]MCA4134679.1 4'-phosphopantetheinyl transferase superfamily protein [Arthrobacter sp. M4]